MPAEPASRIRSTPSETEQGLRWRMFEQTISEAHRRFSDLPTEELQAIIDDAVMTARQNP